jgi:hypothetical protein
VWSDAFKASISAISARRDAVLASCAWTSVLVCIGNHFRSEIVLSLNLGRRIEDDSPPSDFSQYLYFASSFEEFPICHSAINDAEVKSAEL